MKRLALFFTASALALFVSAGIASSALAAPVWALDSSANTAVSAGGQLTYYLVAQNNGDDTDGSQIDLTVDLPAELTAVSASSIDGATFDCSSLVVGSSDPFACTSSDTLGFQVGTIVAVVAAVSPSATGDPTAEFAISGGGGATVSTVNATRIASTPPGFGVDSFDGQVTADEAGNPFTQAGGHPYAAATQVLLNTVTDPLEGDVWPVEPIKDLIVDLPPGLVGDPTNMGRCTAQQLLGTSGNPLCPSASQVGVVQVYTNGAATPELKPVFSMAPPPDAPARFGFSFYGTLVTLDATVRSNGDYGLSIVTRNSPEPFAVAGVRATFWGNPSNASHDSQRWCPDTRTFGCTTAPTAPLLRLPTSCPAPGTGLTTGLRVSSWNHPAEFKTASFVSHLAPNFPFTPSVWGAPVGPTDCDKVPFGASLSGAPESPALANQPAGFAFDLTIPQNASDEIGQSDLKKAVVTLPVGVRVSPSSADGLQGCSPAQIALSSTAESTCPDGSKLGKLTITTPVLDDPLEGAVYLATPHDNPSGTLVAIYLVARGPGLVVKLAGRVDIDLDTGQLTATFDNQPQLPFSKLHLEFFGGSRAALVLPRTCGTYTTHAELTSWSGKTRPSDSSFTLDRNGKGQACGGPKFAPDFKAGTVNPAAGKHSPFVMTLTRDDEDEELASLTAQLPPGLTGYLKGIPYCPEATLAGISAALGTGAAELASPACPAASQLGSVAVGAGSGPNPFYVNTGKAYLAGPYNGAPISLAIVTPALAGPFDLGNVVVRVPLRVDPATAQITASGAPIPSILHGIPLQVRDIRVNLDRPNFTLNPTSCDELAVSATATSTTGAAATLHNRFQVGECAALGFKPRLNLRLFGKTNRGAHPKLRAVLRMPQRNQANIARTAVTLPASAFLDQSHLNNICTRVRFAEDNCPKGSIYGYAKAITPLLDEPLRGPVYLRSSNNKLPDLVAALQGQIDIELVGRIDSVKLSGGGTGIRTTFETVPDAPVSKFVLTMKGGRKGLIQNSTNLCAGTNRATVKMDAHNGKIHDSRPLVKAQCKGKGNGGKRLAHNSAVR